MTSRPSTAPRGFSLIELLITLAVMGVLASIAYPAYTRHVERSDRAQARAALLEAAQYLERYYTTQGTYLNAVLPDRLRRVPAGPAPAAIGGAAVAARYNLQLVVNATDYTVIAMSNNAQDECGDLSINHLGVRAAARANGANGQPDPQRVANCWR